MNPNTEFEQFTQCIYQELVNNDALKPTNVQHNVKLEGRSGQMHQIDVYWEYEIAGNKHRVAIECKNYSKPVSKDKVCAFKGVLDDLNGVNGIMVTKVGYQKGAKEYAKEYGISLKELRSPKEGETNIGEINLQFYAVIRYALFKVDEDWAIKHHLDIVEFKKRLDMIDQMSNQKWSNASYIPLPTNDRVIRNAEGKKIISLETLEKALPNHPTDDFPFVYSYDDAYINTPLGTVKILELKFEYEIVNKKQLITLDAGNFVKAILKDALSDRTDFMVMC